MSVWLNTTKTFQGLKIKNENRCQSEVVEGEKIKNSGFSEFAWK